MGTTIKWNAVFKRLMTLMDTPGASYFSGPRFIRAMQDFNEDLPNYTDYIDGRQRAGKSTTRSYFFKDILMNLDEGVRVRAVSAILDELQAVDGNTIQVSEIRTLLGGGTLAPTATIPVEAWNAERLNGYLAEIDAAIASGNFDRAVTFHTLASKGFSERSFGQRKNARRIHTRSSR